MAIARDAVSDGLQSAGTTLTFSHTVSGSNTALFVGFSTQGDPGDAATGVTYDSVSMTQIIKVDSPTSGNFVYIYGILAPNTGANDIVITFSTSTLIYAIGTSYTGVGQGQTLTDITDTDQANAGTTTTMNMTTTVNDSWGFMFVKCDNGGIAGASGTTLVDTTSNSRGGALEKDFGTSGSETMDATQTANGNTAAVSLAFAPVSVSSFIPQVMIY